MPPITSSCCCSGSIMLSFVCNYVCIVLVLVALVGCFGKCCNLLVHGFCLLPFVFLMSCAAVLWTLMLVLATLCCRLLEREGDLGILSRSMLFTILVCLLAARSCALLCAVFPSVPGNRAHVIMLQYCCLSLYAFGAGVMCCLHQSWKVCMIRL